MKYYLWVKQSGGCDYTIACGETLIEIEAENVVGAQKQTVTTLRELGWGPDRDIELEYARLIIVQDIVDVELDVVLQRLRAEKEQQRTEATQRREVAEYERLRQKYEKQ